MPRWPAPLNRGSARRRPSTRCPGRGERHDSPAGGQTLRHALAFHLGGVPCGDIGGAGRLDVTAIGRGVNRTARLETVAADLGRDVAATL
ncbi:MAG: hypothetical protein V3R98_10060 [Alphaproteobacteria bacterium]